MILAARPEASPLSASARQLADEPDRVWQDDQVAVHVTDETGLVLFVVSTTAVVAPAMAMKRRLG